MNLARSFTALNKLLGFVQISRTCVAQSHSQPALTAETYNVKRGNYSTANASDLDAFRNIVGDNNVVTEASELQGNNVDWIKTVRGQSTVLLKPKTTTEVSRILKHCNERKLAVCPQGGNTGLVGGSVPVFDEIILSTQRMNEVISVDPFSGVMVCQAGCILEKANQDLLEHDLIVPLDLGAKGSCHLGGNISTNAGGLRLLRYGSLRGSVLGVEAVLADGTVLDCLSKLRKDNTGYDIKQLMIGSEGTLGFVTAVSILCPQKPKSVNVVFLGVDKFEDLLLLLRKAKQDLGEILSAVEFVDSDCIGLVGKHLKLVNPIGEYEFYMLIETSGSNSQHDEEKLSSFVEDIITSQLAKDGTIATDFNKMQSIWKLRESVAEALTHDGYTFKYDVSLPAHVMYDMVHDTRKHLKGLYNSVVGYGHLGDGNLHLNVTCPEYNKTIASAIEPFVYEWTAKHNGSISAEHGLGFKKRNYISYTKSKESINFMMKIKQMFDPNMILNPYKTLPDKL
uniref:D-2-hydroxyglutarate dehydrogenase, mitochondrial-like n=1 Tax=Ciona intestinalis TaxID=7719 RepID=UPI000180BEFF|nr:D-2-hydroxyglutarate dehydrogenase, mitochondrial-like [Ciona intestinalis]|eukprot:XP_002131340.1 D-2-hydroxyglutarate dehydrogenase, mitochondrial-like [Ciona intestinalis]